MFNLLFVELNKENGSNYKLSVLKKYKDSELLQRVLKMCYDKVSFTYGVKKIWGTTSSAETTKTGPILELSESLDFLESYIVTRKLTGHAALAAIQDVMNRMWTGDQTIFGGIINRDLRLNLGRTTINKVWPNLIVKPPYMRCGVYSEKAAEKINFPAYVQLKSDGTMRYIIKEGERVTFMSRSGEESEYPILKDEFLKFPDGVYVGEMLVANEPNRQKANGLINSDTPPHDDIILQCWDFIYLQEFSDAKHCISNLTRIPYRNRFNILSDIIDSFSHLKLDSHISKIPSKLVNNLKEALEMCSFWMNDGFEGAILKDTQNIFKDHTSPTQLKLKLAIDADVRVVGFSEGTPGTKREKTFGALMYENDEGTVKGQCSGFTDQQLEDFNSRRSELIGKIITVQFNDLTKGSGSETYALNHPRFIELRNDKDETDTIERLFELKNMAVNGL